MPSAPLPYVKSAIDEDPLPVKPKRKKKKRARKHKVVEEAKKTDSENEVTNAKF